MAAEFSQQLPVLSQRGQKPRDPFGTTHQRNKVLMKLPSGLCKCRIQATRTASRSFPLSWPLSADDHDRPLSLAASHERSATAEICWAVQKWLDEHVPARPLLERPDFCFLQYLPSAKQRSGSLIGPEPCKAKTTKLPVTCGFADPMKTRAPAGVRWIGHFSGFGGGLLAALVVAREWP